MKRQIAIIATLLAASAGVGAENPKPVKGTRVVLTPPPGFEVAKRFPGFQSEETGASLMVTQLPSPFKEATRGYHVLFDEDGYYVMQGIGPAGEGEALLKTFKKLARSFTKVETPRPAAR